MAKNKIFKKRVLIYSSKNRQTIAVYSVNGTQLGTGKNCTTHNTAASSKHHTLSAKSQKPKGVHTLARFIGNSRTDPGGQKSEEQSPCQERGVTRERARGRFWSDRNALHLDGGEANNGCGHTRARPIKHLPKLYADYTHEKQQE